MNTEDAPELNDAEREAMRERVIEELKTVFDPEIPVNIYELGLVYEVEVKPDAHVLIQMTLTSQACPEARTIPEVMKRRVEDLDGIEACEIEIVWEPQWTPHKISPEGRQVLGIEDLPPEPFLIYMDRRESTFVVRYQGVKTKAHWFPDQQQ